MKTPPKGEAEAAAAQKATAAAAKRAEAAAAKKAEAAAAKKASEASNGDGGGEDKVPSATQTQK